MVTRQDSAWQECGGKEGTYFEAKQLKGLQLRLSTLSSTPCMESHERHLSLSLRVSGACQNLSLVSTLGKQDRTLLMNKSKSNAN